MGVLLSDLHLLLGISIGWSLGVISTLIGTLIYHLIKKRKK